MKSPFGQQIRSLLLWLPVLALVSGLAAWFLAPTLLEGVIRRSLNRLPLPPETSLRVGKVDIRGPTRIGIAFVHLAQPPLLEVEAREVLLRVRPLGLLIGGRPLESVQIQNLVVQVDSADRLPEGIRKMVRWIRSSGNEPSPAEAHRPRGRWPDVEVLSLSGSLRTASNSWSLRNGEVHLVSVPGALGGGERRLSGRFSLETDGESDVRLDLEGALEPGVIREVSARLTPSVRIPLGSGVARIGGLRWTPDHIALLDLAWQGPSGRHLEIQEVEADVRRLSPAEKNSGVFPGMDRWPAELTAIFGGLRPTEIVVNQPTWRWIPGGKASTEPTSPDTDAETGQAPAAWLVRTSRRLAQRLDDLRALVQRVEKEIPRIPVRIHDALFLPIQPGELPANPSRALTRLDASLGWTPNEDLSLEVRLDCPDGRPGTISGTISADLGRWIWNTDLRDLPVADWSFLWTSPESLPRVVLQVARGRVEVDYPARRLQAEGQVGLGPLQVSLPAIASAPLTFQDLGISGRLDFDWDRGTLSFSSGEFRTGRLVVPFSVEVSRLNASPRIRVQGAIPRLAASDLVASVPPELLGSLRDVRMEGTFAGRFALDLDTANLDAIQLDLEPDVSDLRVLSLGQTVDLGLLRSVFLHQIEETDGTVVQRQVGENTPFWVPLSSLPPWLVPMLTLAEDATFFRHRGFSPSAIRRSLRVNLERGRFVQGASTLSQQLVKNLFLSREKTLSRKIQEALLTWQLEQSLEKERILELYLNIIEWGPEVFGIREAAGHYFAKHPEELTPMETALLVAAIPGPRLFHEQMLKLGRPPTLFRNRAEALVREMGRQRVLSPEQVEAALAETPRFVPVEVQTPPPPSTEGLGYEPSPMPPPLPPEDP